MNYSSFQNICQVFYFDDGSVQKRCKSNGELVLIRAILKIRISISSRVMNYNREELVTFKGNCSLWVYVTSKIGKK